MSQSARNNPEEARLEARRADLAMEHYYTERDNPREECVECFDYTGRTAGEDGLYRTDGVGPLCDACFNKEPLIIEMEKVTNEPIPTPFPRTS